MPYAVAFMMLAIAFSPRATSARPAHSTRALMTRADTMGQFPRVEGSNLEDRRFALPADFEGEWNVVLVAFQREQQRDVDSWMPFLHRLAARAPALRTYELPTLGRGYRLMRPFIDGGMRRGIPDAAVRAATITLYIDKGTFRRALALPGEDRIHVLLVNREGTIAWRGSGPFDARSAADLEGRIDALFPDRRPAP